jgi:hypothetical protein
MVMAHGMVQLKTLSSTGKSRSVCMSGSLQLVATSQMSRNSPCSKQPSILCNNFVKSKATAALLKVHTKQDLDYEAYTSLLLSTASDYDSKHVASKGKRQVYSGDLDHDDADLYDASYKMDPFDVDTPVDTIQAFASKFTPRPGMKDKVRMPKDKWFGIDLKTTD